MNSDYKIENSLSYYLAGPGFNEKQLDRIHQVEAILDKMEVNYYSPFKKGNRLDPKLDKDLLKLNVNLIFEENIDCLNQVERLIALVDDLDKGTLFEIGYFVAKEVYTSGFGLAWLDRTIKLLGSHANEISGWIVDLLEKSKNKKDKSEVHKLEFFVQDLNQKVEKDYLTMGWMFFNSSRIITFSDKELDSNVMTACSTFHHVIGNREDALKIGKNPELVKDKLFNLDAFKSFTKID